MRGDKQTMPLVYDEVPGSWGEYSKDWPKIEFKTEEEARVAYVLCHRVAKIPFGSYVLADFELRLETEAYADRVRMVLTEKE
jgi:hypothetical protein